MSIVRGSSPGNFVLNTYEFRLGLPIMAIRVVEFFKGGIQNQKDFGIGINIPKDYVRDGKIQGQCTFKKT